MKTYLTEIEAIDPITKNLCKWAGPNVPGISFAHAQHYCETHGLGYCKVIGQLMSKIPCDKEGMPDISKETNYDFSEN